MRYKAVTANFLTVVDLLVEPSPAILKTISSLEESHFISLPNIQATSISPIISPPLSRSLFSAVYLDQIVEVTKV